jgi:hypothetical protein
MLVDRANSPRPVELAGTWPEKMQGAPVKA